MKKNVIMLLVVFVMTFGLALSAQAEAEGSASAGVAVMSQYVWRGLILSEEAVVQPTIDFAYGDFGANFWANQDTKTDENNETDLTISYGKSFDKVSVGVGYIYYGLNAEDPETETASWVQDTSELYLSLSYDFVVTPTVTYYQDIDEGEGGGFGTLGLEWGMDVNEKVSIGLGALAGYNFENPIMGLDENGDKFSAAYQGEVSGSISYSEGPFTIDLMGTYATALSDEAEYVMEQTSLAVTEEEEDSVFFYGASLTVGF